MEAERDKRLGRGAAAVLFIWVFFSSSSSHPLPWLDAMIIICL
jgi:hypothetical protein